MAAAGKHIPQLPYLQGFYQVLSHKTVIGRSLSPKPSRANQIRKSSQKSSQPPIIINLDGHLIGTMVSEQG